MVGVYTYHARIISDSTFIQGDQNASIKTINSININGYRFSLVFIKSLACALIKSVEIVACGDAFLDFHREAITVGQHTDERHEKIVHSFPELLHVGVLIGRSFVSVNGDSLIHNISIEVQFLPNRFHDELLQVL